MKNEERNMRKSSDQSGDRDIGGKFKIKQV